MKMVMVTDRVRDLNSTLLNMCVLCACRIERETCSQSHLTYALCACRIEYGCCSQSRSTCAFSMHAEQNTRLEAILCAYAFLCVPNRVRDLHSILLDMRNLRQSYLTCAFSKRAKQGATLEVNLTQHERFLCVPKRVLGLINHR